MWIQTLHNSVHESNVRGHDNQAIREAMHRLRQYGFKVSNHYMPWLYTSTPEMDEETFRIAFSTPWIKSDELKFYPTAVIPNTPLYDLYKSWEYEPIKENDLKKLIRTFKTKIIPPYSRIKRLARDFDTNEVVAWANTPNLRQLVMKDLMDEFSKDEKSRKKQYKRLSDSQQVEQSNSYKVASLDTLLKKISIPMGIDSRDYVSISHEKRDIDDRLETYCIGECFDTNSERNFVCLCTRCREFRNREKNQKSELTLNPFLVIRRYRSSNGEELFLSIEDALWYLYGFTRLLLPDEWVAIDFAWVQEWKALIRELHVYWNLASLDSESKKQKVKSKKTAQDKGFGRQLMEAAELVSETRWYTHLSVISWIWVKGYYKKLGYTEDGTYVSKKFKVKN